MNAMSQSQKLVGWHSPVAPTVLIANPQTI
jgi:hypothetical protein